jgi:hypothetical protein
MESWHVKFYESETKWSKSCPVVIPLAQKSIWICEKS